MAAYNWIVFEAECPRCHAIAEMEAQTHLASSFGGDDSGRFCHRRFRLGERMPWYPRDHVEFAEWSGPQGADEDVAEEACYVSCPRCATKLYAIVRVRDFVVEAIVGLGLESQWPEGYWR